MSRESLSPEELTGCEGRQEFSQPGRGPIENLDQARDLSARFRFGNRLYEARINVHLIRRDEDQNRCAAMVPEFAVKPHDLVRFDSVHLLEVDEGRAVRVEDPVQVQRSKARRETWTCEVFRSAAFKSAWFATNARPTSRTPNSLPQSLAVAPFIAKPRARGSLLNGSMFSAP